MTNVKMVCPIKNLDQLLEVEKIVFVETLKLTEAGDNYGSTILGVNITINDGSSTESIQTVAKMLPPNAYIQKMFNSQKTFQNEIGFYQKIIPCLKQFQREQGMNKVIDCSPEFIAARTSLNPLSTTVDEDAILLIKNLKKEGFEIIDRTKGFDLLQSQIILEKLAELHGTTMALQLLQPEKFSRKLQPFFEPFQIFAVDKDKYAELINAILKPLQRDEICRKNNKRIEDIFYDCLQAHNKNSENLQKSKFLGLVHMDLWCNNIMIKRQNNSVLDVKFIDFQLYEYSSVSRDVVFFIFTSVDLEVLKEHCDSLLNHYFVHLIKILKKLKCDVSQLSFADFVEDIKTMIRQCELLHILLMMAPIYAQKEDSIHVDNVKNDDMVQQRVNLSLKGQQRSYFIVQEFIRRKWI